MEQGFDHSPALQKLEAKLADGDLELQHRDVLQCTRNFKMGWVALGRSLRAVSQRRLYREWEYTDLKSFCSKELGLRWSTVEKLLRSAGYVERHAPGYYGNEMPVGPKTAAPDLRAVDLLARAEEKNLFATHEGLQESLHSGCFEEGASPAALGRLAARALDEGGREVLGLRQPPPEDPLQRKALNARTASARLVGSLARADAPEELIDQARQLSGHIEAWAATKGVNP
ncbi:MAG: hypothetical protein CMH55_09985 [Myxococcales bacterium]|nr:hypothetical protein [Myxococcales bacterium]